MKSNQTSSTTHMRLYLKRILVGFAVILPGLVVFLYMALPVGMGVYAVLPGRETVGGMLNTTVKITACVVTRKTAGVMTTANIV